MAKNLATRFLEYLQGEYGTGDRTIEPSATDVLRQTRFPGLDSKATRQVPPPMMAPMDEDILGMLQPSNEAILEDF